MSKRRPLAERFWEKVDKDGPMHPYRPELGQCWMWTGATYGTGHGAIRNATGRAPGKALGAHRVSWSLHREASADGLCVCHSCDNPPCVNPDHLFLGTVLDNNRDKETKGRAKHTAGSANGNARLTESDVKTIRAIYSSGWVTQMDLAKRYGVRQTLISMIVLRQAWRHI